MSVGGRVSVYNRSQIKNTPMTNMALVKPTTRRQRMMDNRQIVILLFLSLSVSVMQKVPENDLQKIHKISIHSAGVITVSAVF